MNTTNSERTVQGFKCDPGDYHSRYHTMIHNHQPDPGTSNQYIARKEDILTVRAATTKYGTYQIFYEGQKGEKSRYTTYDAETSLKEEQY